MAHRGLRRRGWLPSCCLNEGKYLALRLNEPEGGRGLKARQDAAFRVLPVFYLVRPEKRRC